MSFRHVLLGFVAATFVATPMLARSEERLQFSGDVRGRWEGFRFSEDESGNKKERRGRLRYRLRLNGKAVVNDYASVAIRIGTGESDSRSGNVTLGSPVDFGPDKLGIRRAYLILTPFKNGRLPGREGSWAFQFGRVPNPFITKHAQDKMLWDNDINFSGASTTFGIAAGGSAEVFASTGYFVIDENSTDKDAFLTAIQGGVKGGSDKLTAGGRGTYYYFGRLNEDFIVRGVDGTGGVTEAGGNIWDGLTGDTLGGQMSVVEATLFAKWTPNESWPTLVYGAYSNNLDAAASQVMTDVGKEANAYSAGIEVGNAKNTVLLGTAYYRIEANAFPSQFVDSDILDGVTNRQGAMIYLGRRVITSAELRVAAYYSDAINTSAGFAESVANSERLRSQVDLTLKF